MKKAKKYYGEKLPLIELTFRWVDAYCLHTYSDIIAEDAKYLIQTNIVNFKIIHPTTTAATAIYIACQFHNIPFNHDRMQRITKTYLDNLKIKSGVVGIPDLKERALKWKSNLGSK